jgi:hypothetical protein
MIQSYSLIDHVLSDILDDVKQSIKRMMFIDQCYKFRDAICQDKISDIFITIAKNKKISCGCSDINQECYIILITADDWIRLNTSCCKLCIYNRLHFDIYAIIRYQNAISHILNIPITCDASCEQSDRILDTRIYNSNIIVNVMALCYNEIIARIIRFLSY